MEITFFNQSIGIYHQIQWTIVPQSNSLKSGAMNLMISAWNPHDLRLPVNSRPPPGTIKHHPIHNLVGGFNLPTWF